MAGPYYARAAAPTPGSGTYRGLYLLSTTWAVGDIVVPREAYGTAAAKGFIYRCTSAGTGSGTEPTWAFTTPGTTTTTDGAVWTVELSTTWAYASPRPDYVINNKLAAGEILYLENVSYPLTASTVLTIPGALNNPCSIISTSDTSNAPPTSVATGATFDLSGVAGQSLTINGKAFIYGVNFYSGGSTTASAVSPAQADQSNLQFENCVFKVFNTHASGRLNIGAQSIGYRSFVKTVNCTFILGNNAAQTISVVSRWESVNDTFSITTTVPTALFGSINNTGANIDIIGADLSAITTTLFNPGAILLTKISVYGSRLGSGVAIVGTLSLPSVDIYLFDCSASDNHYEFAHYNYFGRTLISAAIYLDTTEGASYNNAGAKHSWVVTSVNGTYQKPYVSPWIDVYNESTSAVTPRLEILRDGSTTAYNDDQVWGIFSYKGSSGYTNATVVNDRRGLVASAAAQGSSSLGSSDWAGETTPWYGKLEPASPITPAEIGHIRARVAVVGTNVVYVNPKILGI